MRNFTMKIAYFNLRTKRYAPNLARDFDAALIALSMKDSSAGYQSPAVTSSLVKIDDDTYRVRLASGRLSSIELRRVTVVGNTLLFKNEPPANF
jgi:hypothetical protein